MGPLFRLTAAVWILLRADALAPRESRSAFPPLVRTITDGLRLLAGRSARRGRPGERLAAALERLGPVGIKFGQFLSTRADILGTEFAFDLGRLKDRLPPFSSEAAKAEIVAALGMAPLGLLAELGEPVAAASLAQAHRARLVDGRDVAIKVLRPGIERRVARDAAALRLGARLVAGAVPPARRLAPKAFVETVIRALDVELDMRLEAAGADELREVMEDSGYMRAPAVVWPAVSRRVLTLEWVAGVALSDPAALETPGLDRAAIATKLIRSFLSQALDHGVFHADLHEGNLFISPPSTLTAVDFGIIGRLAARERRFLAEILWGFLRRDYRRVADIHFRAGYVGKEHDPAVFAQALRAVGEPIFGRSASGLSMGRLLAQLFETTALFDMALRPELVLLQKTMVTVEGVARRVDPEHDIWRAAEPVVRRWIERELSPPVMARRLVGEAVAVARALAESSRSAAASAPPPDDDREADKIGPAVAFLLGVLTSSLAFAAAWLVR